MKRLIILVSIAVLSFVSCKQEVNYTISTKVQPDGGGSIVMTPSSKSVLEGTSVSFTANPNGDYAFTGWSGSISGTENPKTVTVTSDMSIVANFTLKTYPLTLSIEGEGIVTERVISTKTEYGSGTVVELTAKPSNHWLFDHWEVDLNGNTNPVQITVASAKSVKAVFVPKMYDLTVEVEGEGTVSEAVVKARSGSYQEGTTVELTATPGTGWSFDHWERDLTGSDNPVQILISTAKTVKAVFTKNHYAYNLKIVGPGVVDEYLVEETKTGWNHGTRILLKAIPSERAVFKGWGGDVSGSEMDLEIKLERELDIKAVFEQKEAPYYPPVDLKLPSRCYSRIYPHIDVQSVGTGPTLSLQLDYNRDGYIDLFSSPAGHTPEEWPDLRFYFGGKDLSLFSDPLNDAKTPGMTGCRKCIYGDYNGDGLPDICIIGGGWDAPPWPGDYPLIMMSNPTMEYSLLRMEECNGKSPLN